MSKRPRSPHTTPYVLYGRALPPLDSSTRDDGSYVPVWKQEVTDERGRKRLHGAFTGGFSAGYFNTVGSKEGWTPQTFKSSRGARAKAGPSKPEDFMDEEDLREAEEARVLETSESFAGIGGGGEAELRGGLMGLLVTSETMGTRLLKKMGWKEGQGVGARRLRRAAGDEGKEYLFAPENSPLVGFVRKDGAAGLGYEGEAGLAKRVHIEEEEAPTRRAPKKSAGAAFGVGILNDDGEDDEDPYEIRPKTLYNKTIGGDKPRKKAPAKHVFIPKKSTALKPHQSFRKCHDGRLPLPGFILSDAPVPPAIPRYPPPVVPDSWNLVPAEPAAAAPAAQEGPKLDPRTRGALLGEAPLPGKSVFDFLTPDARNRIANLTGKAHLPPGLGEAPASTTRSTIADLVPALDSEASLSALKGGFMPYGDDPDKRARYRSFLEVKAGLREGLPERKYGMNTQDWAKELNEFVGAARIFKPLTGTMATRFTTSTTTASNFQGNMDRGIDGEVLVHRPAEKPEDPAEAAAKLGMYGPLTRSTVPFTPCRLLCKRFNVPFVGIAAETGSAPVPTPTPTPGYGGDVGVAAPLVGRPELGVDADKNEALEGEKAAEEVFRNIFGDSDDEED